MLYRPNFCANCGEKVERADWSLFTSRRFCQVCESEYKGQDTIPRVIVGFGILAGVLGLGSYLKSGSPSEAALLRQPGKLVERSSVAARPPGSQTSNANANVVAGPPEVPTFQAPPQALTDLRQAAQVPGAKSAQPEPQYYCGAETKKGTPCSRRVKGNVRCYQHVGMPAMVSSEKLKMN